MFKASRKLGRVSTGLQDRKDMIKVCVRIRPMSGVGHTNNTGCWTADETTIVDNEDARISHSFERVFLPGTATHELYDAIVQNVVQEVIAGFNGTVFAYGQTGSGKTHTIMGSGGEKGLIDSAIEQVFAAATNPDSMFLLRASYMEVYNEEVYDLLNPNLNSKRDSGLRVMEMTKSNFGVQGLTEVVVRTPASVQKLLKEGNERRAVGVSNFNEHSSRSHSLFRLVVESTDRVAPEAGGSKEACVRVSELNFVDLAGSEKYSDEYGVEQQRETKAINSSLSTLKHVIRALSSEVTMHVPYRDSTLTKLLRCYDYLLLLYTATITTTSTTTATTTTTVDTVATVVAAVTSALLLETRWGAIRGRLWYTLPSH